MQWTFLRTLPNKKTVCSLTMQPHTKAGLMIASSHPPKCPSLLLQRREETLGFANKSDRWWWETSLLDSIEDIEEEFPMADGTFATALPRLCIIPHAIHERDSPLSMASILSDQSVYWCTELLAPCKAFQVWKGTTDCCWLPKVLYIKTDFVMSIQPSRSLVTRWLPVHVPAEIGLRDHCYWTCVDLQMDLSPFSCISKEAILKQNVLEALDSVPLDSNPGNHFLICELLIPCGLHILRFSFAAMSNVGFGWLRRGLNGNPANGHLSTRGHRYCRRA